jgi:antitoxin MazE
MKTKIVKIGNSKGIRIPKAVLDQTGLEGEVELDVKGNELVIKAIRNPREGWAVAFEKMAKHKDDQLIDGDLRNQTVWDEEEWEW